MNYCRNFVKVRVFVDGCLSKDVKEENNMGIEEFHKDLMEDGAQFTTILTVAQLPHSAPSLVTGNGQMRLR